MKKLLTSTLSSPLLWGAFAAFGFYFGLRHGLFYSPLLVRYTAGHPVEYITVCLFFIGMTSLLFKGIRIVRQERRLVLGPVFPPIKEEREGIDQADHYLYAVEKAQVIRGASLHLDRLRKAVFFLKSSGKADELDSELRALADDDAYEAEREYGMVRMFIWAIPILGFLGTVVGITMALGHLDLTELETSSQQLASGLNVAFDTTALALTLVFFLYFSLFFVQQQEKRLFERVNRLVDSELRGRFLNASSPAEQEEFRIVRHILQSVAESFDALLQAQVQRWDEAIRRLDQQGTETLRIGTEQIAQTLGETLAQSIGESFSRSIRESADRHAESVQAVEEKLLGETLTPYIRALKDGGESIAALRSQIAEEGNLFREILEATGQVTMLEERLNQNLERLSETGSFTETVQTLAAAVRLLSGRLEPAAKPSRNVPHLSNADIVLDADLDIESSFSQESDLSSAEEKTDEPDRFNGTPDDNTVSIPRRFSFLTRRTKRGVSA